MKIPVYYDFEFSPIQINFPYRQVFVSFSGADIVFFAVIGKK